MKIIVHGPAAGPGPSGLIESWAPDQPVDIDDTDKKAVTWARYVTSTPLATLIEDAPADATVRRGPGRPRKHPAEAEAVPAEPGPE